MMNGKIEICFVGILHNYLLFQIPKNNLPLKDGELLLLWGIQFSHQHVRLFDV